MRQYAKFYPMGVRKMSGENKRSSRHLGPLTSKQIASFFSALAQWLFEYVLVPALLLLLLGGAIALGLLLANFGVVSLAVGATISLSLCLALITLACCGEGFLGQNSPVERAGKIGGSIGLLIGVLAFFALSTWGGLFALPALGGGAMMLAISAVVWGTVAAGIGLTVGTILGAIAFFAIFRDVTPEEMPNLKQKAFSADLQSSKADSMPAVILSDEYAFCLSKAAKANAVQKHGVSTDGDEGALLVSRDGVNTLFGFGGSQ